MKLLINPQIDAIYQQVIDEVCENPLYRFAELIAADAIAQHEQEPVAAVELLTIGSEQIIAVAWYDSNAFKIGVKLYTAPPITKMAT